MQSFFWPFLCTKLMEKNHIIVKSLILLFYLEKYCKYAGKKSLKFVHNVYNIIVILLVNKLLLLCYLHCSWENSSLVAGIPVMADPSD